MKGKVGGVEGKGEGWKCRGMNGRDGREVGEEWGKNGSGRCGITFDSYSAVLLSFFFFFFVCV